MGESGGIERRIEDVERFRGFGEIRGGNGKSSKDLKGMQRRGESTEGEAEGGKVFHIITGKGGGHVGDVRSWRQICGDWVGGSFSNFVITLESALVLNSVAGIEPRRGLSLRLKVMLFAVSSAISPSDLQNLDTQPAIKSLKQCVSNCFSNPHLPLVLASPG